MDHVPHDNDANAQGPLTGVSGQEAEEREQLRQTLVDLIDRTQMPLSHIQSGLGCSRATVHNWINGAEMSYAYVDKVARMVDVLKMGLALDMFPITTQGRRGLYAKSYSAIDRLHSLLYASKEARALQALE